MANEEEKTKKGFTVGEIEGHFKKFGVEIVLVAVFVLSLIFDLLWGKGMRMWSIILCMAFGIVGVFIPKYIHKGTKECFRLVTKDKITAIIVSILAILISIFIPVAIFALVGLIAGTCLIISAKGCCGKCNHKEQEHEYPEKHEEQHEEEQEDHTEHHEGEGN